MEAGNLESFFSFFFYSHHFKALTSILKCPFKVGKEMSDLLECVSYEFKFELSFILYI